MTSLLWEMTISDLKKNVEKCQLDASLKDLQTDYVVHTI
jgi:hypothetical protein